MTPTVTLVLQFALTAGAAFVLAVLIRVALKNPADVDRESVRVEVCMNGSLVELFVVNDGAIPVEISSAGIEVAQGWAATDQPEPFIVATSLPLLVPVGRAAPVGQLQLAAMPRVIEPLGSAQDQLRPWVAGPSLGRVYGEFPS